VAPDVFDLAFPFTTEWKDPQPAIQGGSYDGKLLIVNSEFDKSGSLVDMGVARDQYRFYAVAGTPHCPTTSRSPFASALTPGSYEFALRAHFLQGDRPTPVEYVLHALAACLTAGPANIAAARGIRLTEAQPTWSVTSTSTASSAVAGPLGAAPLRAGTPSWA
jgi:OsmC-like protein